MERFYVPAGLLIGLAITSPALASPQPAFYCEVPGGEVVLETLPISPQSNEGRLRFYGQLFYLSEESVALEAYPIDIEYAKLPRAPSGSGERYETHGISFHAKGDSGVFSMPDGRTFQCQSAELKYPSAQSLFGSIIRDKPSTSGKMLTKVPKGYELKITEQTGLVHDDWKWVQVEYEEFTYGYVWGGTICTTTHAVSGVHLGC